MKLASYRHQGRSSVGLVLDDRLFDVSELRSDAPTAMKELLAWLDANPGALDVVVPTGVEGRPVSEIAFLPVVPDPHAIWCAALTYLSHVREAPNRSAPEYPLFFLRVANSQLGHQTAMVVPAASEQLDYEGELAVVIGRRGRHIPQERAYEHIAGYACYNDGSVRDWQRHTSQITPGKNFAATGGFGPWLVTPDEFGDPTAHSLETRLNGNVMQAAKISELLFSVEYMIHYLSTLCPLEVGDVIVTGTCGGVGVRRNPPVFLRPGDVIEVEIDGIGVLSNPVVAETES
jgi:2-keto-4-pentenoate hydratase/2-oxohepta-3-ene-1,7-dioic acid hydratase in catechol pathway